MVSHIMRATILGVLDESASLQTKLHLDVV